MEASSLKMFLRPLSDAEILALYHPRQPPDERGGGGNVEPSETYETAERNMDPTINATKFLAGHPAKDCVMVTSGEEDNINKGTKSPEETSGDKLEPSKDGQSEIVAIELTPAEADVQAEKRENLEEYVEKKTANEPLEPENSTCSAFGGNEKESSQIVSEQTEDSVLKHQPAVTKTAENQQVEDKNEHQEIAHEEKKSEVVSEEHEVSAEVTSIEEEPSDPIKTVLPVTAENAPVEEKEASEKHLGKGNGEKFVDQDMEPAMNQEDMSGSEKPDAFKHEDRKDTLEPLESGKNVAEPAEEELDRLKLVDIININIAKFSRNVSYSGNETAQRKVRSVFNIINDSQSAEDIYDKILCEGLQWFVEFHAEDEDVAREEYRDSQEDEDLRFPPGRQLILGKDSIVSKVLHEVNAPKIERKEKAEAEESSQKGSSSDSVDFSITRNKASRQMKKYVRTGSGQRVDKSEEVTAAGDEEERSEQQCPKVTFSLDDKTDEEQTKPRAETETSNYAASRTKEGPSVSTSNGQQSSIKAGLEVPGGAMGRCSPTSPPTGGRRSLDVDREGGRELSIEVAERRMKTHAVERSFSDALREGKAKRREKRRTSAAEEDSIVNRLLRERALGQATNKSEAEKVMEKKETIQEKQDIPRENFQNQTNEKKGDKLGQAAVEKVPIDVKSLSEIGKVGRVARERTESECSETMPDLEDPVEQEAEEQRRLEEMRKEMEEMEEMRKKMEEAKKSEAGLNSEPEKKLLFSEEISKEPETEKDRELTPIFLTNFDDDESEAEVSSADVTENLAPVEIETEVVGSQVRSVVESLVHEIFEQKSTDEQPKTEITPANIDSFIKNLVSRIIDLVLTLSRKEMQAENSTTLARGTFQMTGLETESEDESEISEMSECENVNDMFDLSMKRLNFIENSFKTMSSSTLDLRSITPDVQALTHHGQDDADKEIGGEIGGEGEADEKLQKIQQILASAEGNSDEKLKLIDNIVNGGKKL